MPATGGATLPKSLQQRAQQSLQAHFDFSRVRVHRDDASVAHHNAVAYTVGTNIVLGGNVGPLTSPEGMRLLGHELAHVVQQGRGGNLTTPPLPGNPLEQAADRAGDAFAAERPSQVEGAANVGIARTPKSLGQTLVPSSLSDSELEVEIMEIRIWLMTNPRSSEESNILEQAMAGLEEEVLRRRAPGGPHVASTPPGVAETEAESPGGLWHQVYPSSQPILTPSIPRSTVPTDAEVELERRRIEGEIDRPARWVPIIQHWHLGTFGEIVVMMTAPWQGAEQTGPDPTAGYNFDTYITNPKTGTLIPAQHLGGTRFRVFMGSPECPGCHFGRGLEIDILGVNPLLIFGPSLATTGSQLRAPRAPPPTSAKPLTSPPSSGFTPRVIQGGGTGTQAMNPQPAIVGNTALKLDLTVAQAPVPSLRSIPMPAPVPVQPPASLPNPALPAAAAAASAASPGASPAAGASQATATSNLQQDESNMSRIPTMRSQIQRGNDNLGSRAVIATQPDRGVTAREFEQVAMVGALANYMERIANRTRPFGVVGNESNIIGAFARQSMSIRSSIVPNGWIPGGEIRALREEFTDAQTGRTMRVDVQNNIGHNLRFAE